jgi:hypothetical protein
MLRDALQRRRPEGILDSTKDFMLDRLDDALEPLARLLTGKAEWDEMKENALRATRSATGGARLAAHELAALARTDPSIEIHLVAHSAGAIFHAPLVQLLCSDSISAGPLEGEQGLGIKIATCTLWAPACTSELFADSYLPALAQGRIGNLTLFTLSDNSERGDNCGKIYNKSLLYLVSDAFEDEPRIPLLRDGVPIAGMAKFLGKGTPIGRLIAQGKVTWIQSPNNAPDGSQDAARAHGHGEFDDDASTLEATLARILGRQKSVVSVTTRHSASGQRAIRRQLNGSQ